MITFTKRKFDPKQLNDALTLAELSRLIYEDPDEVKATLKEEYKALDVYAANHANDMQFAIARFEGGIIIIFKGTKEAEDWLVNIDTEKVPGPWHTRVHRGFYQAMMGVWPMLNAVLKEMQSSSSQRLWITGHSLGGALATITAAQLWTHGRRVHAVYTFGAPRVGNDAFVEAYNKRITHTVRFVYNEDLVPRVPFYRYDHVGDKCYFDQHKNVLWKPSRYETFIDWMNEINFRSMKVTHEDIRRHPAGIADHDMKSYLACLFKNVDVPPDSHKKAADFLRYINE